MSILAGKESESGGKYAALDQLCQIFVNAASPRKDYMRDYMRERYHKKRQDLIKRLGGKCSRCGSKLNLQIDHKDSNKKKFRAADVHSVADSLVEQEIGNLQLLCRNCHKKKTDKSWDYSTPKPKHGTLWMYRRHGCRCKKCVDAYKKKRKEERD
jgi:5-methylcytosine-specific restriction endonuclease McrA